MTWTSRTGRLTIMAVVTVAAIAPCPTPLVAAGGKLQLNVVDSQTGEPIACRMHLKNQAGRPVKAPRQPFFHDHFVFDGTIKLELPRGNYTFELECGPEYLQRSGHFGINDFADDQKHVDMKRFIDMSAEGWWSGDLHVHRPVKDIELLMRADDLHVVPLLTWWNKKSHWQRAAMPKQPLVRFDDDRYYHLMGGENEREGGALLLLNLPRPLDIDQATREYPSGLAFVEQARSLHAEAGADQPPLWVDAEKPFWWDFPVWVAHGMIDSVGLANNHMQRTKMLENEAWGRPRDTGRLPPPLGNALWTQEIYYHLLNCGIRLPPSAGSASGVLPNPIGYNRVYVFVGENFSYEKWWEGFKAGRVMVTNGPLIRPIVAGKLPGHVFQAPAGGELNLDAVLNMATRDKVSYLEVVKNGKVDISLRVEDWAKTGELPTIHFDASGWFLIRAVADNDKTYRFASTGPYYVEVGNQPRISKTSAQFFLDWVDQRRSRIKLTDEKQLESVLKYHDQALQFWQELVDKANAL
jgi:hypothetical protein